MPVILRWLARHVGGWVGLVDVDGGILVGPTDGSRLGKAERRTLATEVARLHAQGTPSAVVGGTGGSTIHLVRVGREEPDTGSGAGFDAGGGAEGRSPYLAVICGPDGQPGPLLADAAPVLGLCWRLAYAERSRRRAESAEAHSREAVLHLLMVGDVPPARRIAAALGSRLPDLLRVYIVECPPTRRSSLFGVISRDTRSQAWLVPCPVRANHLIALVPAASVDQLPERDADLERLIVQQAPDCRLGVGGQVAISATAISYEQAFHALAMARGAPQRFALFHESADLVPLLGAGVRDWAQTLLEPCLRYVPPRRADPDARELLGTLSSWITFDNAASRHLKIHRNTLAGRLRRINELLDVDLYRLEGQAVCWLALRAYRPPGAAVGGRGQLVSLTGLLAAPAARAWAQAVLRPLADGSPVGVDTLRAWLLADARIAATAADLGLSQPAVRKRLVRAERALGRSLLRGPSARHELWLAMRAEGIL